MDSGLVRKEIGFGGVVFLFFFLVVVALLLALLSPSVEAYLPPVINLTGDNASNYLQDFETYGLGHDWGFNNGASGTANTDVCKLNGCYNFSNKTRGTGNHDRLNMSSNNFTVGNGFTFAAWVWHNTSIDGSNSQGYFFFGNDDANNEWYMEQGTSGDHPTFRAANGSVDATAGAGDIDTSRVWVWKVVVYDGVNGLLYTYADNVMTLNSSENFGDLNHSVSDDVWLGVSKSNIDLYGYMDEILIWNSTLTPSELTEIYNSQRFGTPPTRDLYISNLTKSGDIWNVSVSNWGTSASGIFNVTWKLDGSTVCINQSATLTTGQVGTFLCNLSGTGTDKIDLYIDLEGSVVEDDESNNNISFPLIRNSRPFLTPDVNTTWMAANPSTPGEDAWQSHKTFVSENFTLSWTADNLDPRGKKAWENAVGCYINNYNYSANDACQYAMNHLQGWLNGTISVSDISAGSTQNTWGIGHVALTYDLMYNNLTTLERQVFGKRLNDICADMMYNSHQVYLDTQTQTFGNGKMFGSLVTLSCLAGNGVDDDNPVAMYYPSDAKIAYSSGDEFLRRSERATKGLQADRVGEGILYSNYGMFNLARVLWWVKDTGYFVYNESDIDGALLGFLNYFLRFDSQNGADISDNTQYSKFYTFGDSHPYDELGEDNIVGADVLTIMSLLTSNQTLKDAVKTIREWQYRNESAVAYIRPMAGIFYDSIAWNEANNMSVSQLSSAFDAVYRGPTWDYVYYRPTRNYINDTVIIVDGGDIPSEGHPNSEFDIFVSSLGVDWVSYPYVPYEDDVRSEWFGNTLTLQNSTATGYIGLGVTTPALNQIYGGAAEPTTACYPSCNYMPDGYRGTLDEYGNFSSGFVAKMTAKYTNTDVDPYRKVIVQDYGTYGFLIEHVRVNRTTSGYTGLSIININESINSTITGTDLLLMQRGNSNKHYEVEVLYNDSSIYLWKWANNTRASDSKTSFGGLNVTYARYEWYSDNATDWDLVLLHHWYLGSEPSYTVFNNGTDFGYNNGSANISLNLGETDWYTLDAGEEAGSPPDTTPPTWSQSPINQSTYNNTLPLYDLNATDDTAISQYHINDTTNFNITSLTGIVGVITRIPGNYSLNVSVNDTSNNILTSVFNWEIKEYIITPPAATNISDVKAACNDASEGLGKLGIQLGTIAVVVILLFIVGGLYGLGTGSIDLDSGMLKTLAITIIVLAVAIAVGLSIIGGTCV